MLKLYFYAVVDSLSESVVSVFYARSFEHAKQIVKSGFNKNKYDFMLDHLQLVQLSDLIEVPNDYEKITDNLEFNHTYHACEVKSLFDEGEKNE